MNREAWGMLAFMIVTGLFMVWLLVPSAELLTPTICADTVTVLSTSSGITRDVMCPAGSQVKWGTVRDEAGRPKFVVVCQCPHVAVPDGGGQ